MRNHLVNVMNCTVLVQALVLATAAPALACSRSDARHDAPATSAVTLQAPLQAPQVGDSISTQADRGRVQGNPTATVWVVEVSDLQCPFCKDWHEQVFPKIVNEFVKTGKIRLAYVNFPLSQHKYARTAAVAAMCASAQDKFWPMHDALFTSQTKWEKIDDPAPFFEGLAAKSGVNLPAWKSCLSSTSVAALIDADLDRARRAGVQSTPSFIVGGRLIEGAVPYDEFKRAINEAIATGRK